ncbi:hypothetical protein Hdeb2414_s0007g00245581 [Helianthus debilis subsp. tardiflorus]
MEDPADPVDPIDPEFDFEMAFVDPEPALAPEQAVALDHMLEHDPVHAGIPIEPIIADPPVGDLPVDVPLIVDDHVIADDPVVPPLVADIPIDHLVDHVTPFEPVPLEPEHALFADHMDPPDEHAQHGWIPADEDVPPFPPQITDAHHFDFSFQFPQVVPPARPGEGSSAHPFGHVPMSSPFMPQMPSVPHSVAPFHVAPFDPTSEPLLWSSSSPMPPTDPYHPFHVGHTIEDVLMSFVYQHESHTQRLQELERAQLPPWSDTLPSSAMSIITSRLCCPSLYTRAADCFCHPYSAGYGGGLAPVSSLALHLLSPSSAAICIEPISTVGVDVGERTAIAFGCTAFWRLQDDTDF